MTLKWPREPPKAVSADYFLAPQPLRLRRLLFVKKNDKIEIYAHQNLTYPYIGGYTSRRSHPQVLSHSDSSGSALMANGKTQTPAFLIP